MTYEGWRDSSAGGALLLLLGHRDLPGPLMIVKPGECWCGCGTKTSRPGRDFASGHNTRFYGRLDRAEAAGVPVTLNDRTQTAAAWRAELASRPAAKEKARRLEREKGRRILFLLRRLDTIGIAEINELADLTGLYRESGVADIDALEALALRV